MKIVVIPCGGAKLPTPAPASKLYTGSMFQDQLTTALTMVSASQVRILSAKHGLLELDQIVAPYDVKIGDKETIHTDTLADQLAKLGNEIELEGLLPKAYAAALRQAFQGTLKNHFDGTAGIGYQKQTLKNIRKVQA